MKRRSGYSLVLTVLCLLFGSAMSALASEADINIPDLSQIAFSGLGGVTGIT
jgi:hypothetical protein